MKQFNTSPQSQAHCLVARADTQPKPAKELALQTHGQTEIKHETLTSYIKHLAVSALLSIPARIKSRCNLTGKCFEMPNVSYTQPLYASVKRQNSML